MRSVNMEWVFDEQAFPILVRRIAHLDLGAIGTPERLATMSCITSKLGPVSVTALADEQEVRPATMSRMLTSLFADGMINRKGHPTDGRGQLISATAKGLRATEKARETYRQGIRSILASTV